MVDRMKDEAQNITTTGKVLWISFCAALATVVLFLPIIVAALSSSTGNLAFSISRLWARFMLLTTRVKVKTRGRDRITRGGSYIIISNHQSDYDILALVTGPGR